MSMLLRRPRNVTIWTGLKSSRDTVWGGKQTQPLPDYFVSIPGTISENTEMLKALSSSSTSNDWWALEVGLTRSSGLLRRIIGFFYRQPLEIRGWIISPSLSRTDSSRIGRSSKETTSYIVPTPNSPRSTVTWVSDTLFD